MPERIYFSGAGLSGLSWKMRPSDECCCCAHIYCTCARTCSSGHDSVVASVIISQYVLFSWTASPCWTLGMWPWWYPWRLLLLLLGLVFTSLGRVSEWVIAALHAGAGARPVTSWLVVAACRLQGAVVAATAGMFTCQVRYTWDGHVSRRLVYVCPKLMSRAQ